MKQLAFTYRDDEGNGISAIGVEIVEGVDRIAALRKFVFENGLYTEDEYLDDDEKPLDELDEEELYEAIERGAYDGCTTVLSILDIQDAMFIYSLAVKEEE